MIGQKGIPATYGGIEKAVEEISTRLVRRGHKVTVFTRPHYKTVNGTYRGVSIRVLPSLNTKHLDAISHTLLSTLYSLFAFFDIVHYHALGPSLLSFAPRLFGIPTVVTVHGLDWQREKWGRGAKAALKVGECCSVNFPNETVVVAKTLRRYFLSKYRRRVHYIPNGVKVSGKIPLNALKRYGLNGGDYILFVGRLVPEKGCHYLIEAFRRTEAEHRLLIVGGSSATADYIEHLKGRAKDDQRIIFAGYLYGKELQEAYSNAYLFVLPSTLEGLPIVLLEALSYGNCVLASDIPANLEVLKPSENKKYGFLFRSGDEDDLYKKLEYLIANPDRVIEYKAEAEDLLRREYDWERVVDAYERIYTAAMKHGGKIPADLSYRAS